VSYLVDTNVVSELTRRNPHDGVLAWFESVPDSALYLSVLALGEIRKGIEKLEDGSRKEHLRLWVEQELPEWFEDRLLPVDAAVADRWGRLMAEMGRTIPAVDTRNEADFQFPGLQVVNPWRA